MSPEVPTPEVRKVLDEYWDRVFLKIILSDNEDFEGPVSIVVLLSQKDLFGERDQALIQRYIVPHLETLRTLYREQHPE